MAGVEPDGAARFCLPAGLLELGYRLRAERIGDVPFLRRLYAGVRAPELAQVAGWSAERKAAFLDGQFDLQRVHYRTRIDRCRFHVIERDGDPVGRLYLQQRVVNLHIVDISLLPEVRGKGLGTALLRAVIETAARSGRGTGIFVERFNPAMRLYRRLGFVEVEGGEGGVHVEMERLADPVAIS